MTNSQAYHTARAAVAADDTKAASIATGEAGFHVFVSNPATYIDTNEAVSLGTTLTPLSRHPVGLARPGS